MRVVELNIDGLVGPTHNYSGLALGNIAAITHKALPSRPRDAALEGLRKMKAVADLGIPQAFLPPHPRPDIEALRALGFTGTPKEILARAAKEAPQLLFATASASAMWTANAATVTPSVDTADGKTHFSIANLSTKFHRSLEAAFTQRLFSKLFSDSAHFQIHAPLPSTPAFGDEGAANHTRLAEAHDKAGVHLFVYGKATWQKLNRSPQRFPARQSLEACKAIARRHGLAPERALFAQQNADAIDAGVFHNDVAAVGNQNVFLFHEMAFETKADVIESLQKAFSRVSKRELIVVDIPTALLPLEQAIKSYLFNSQLITLPEGGMALVAPEECRQNPAVQKAIASFQKGGWLQKVLYFDLRQSMQNGGGPACLRLRVPLTETELARVHRGLCFDEKRFELLSDWVTKHYPDTLLPEDTASFDLYRKSAEALTALEKIIELPGLYGKIV